MIVLIDIPKETLEYYAKLSDKGEVMNNLESIISAGIPLDCVRDNITDAEEYKQLVEWLKELEQKWLKELEQKRQAFRVACELLNGGLLFGYDTDRIFEEIMDKEGSCCSFDYEDFILEHLDELTGKHLVKEEENND